MSGPRSFMSLDIYMMEMVMDKTHGFSSFRSR